MATTSIAQMDAVVIQESGPPAQSLAVRSEATRRRRPLALPLPQHVKRDQHRSAHDPDRPRPRHRNLALRLWRTSKAMIRSPLRTPVDLVPRPQRNR
jgi:hypothetical protein